MATCDSEVTVFEKNTDTAPKRQDAWKCYGSGGYVEFVDVYNNTEGKIRYKLPLSLVAKYLEVTQGYTYKTHTTSDYIFTLECTIVFYGFQSNAIKVQTCIEPVSTPTPTPTPTPAPTTGTIVCNSHPDGGTVIHNGKTYWQTTDCTMQNVPTGSHMIELRKDKYHSKIFYFTLRAGLTYTINHTFIAATPAPTPTPTPVPQIGNISCITTPSGANVYIDDNTFWKQTNCLVPDVSVGYHKVGYTLAGYMDYVKTIYISPGETEIVSHILIKVQDDASIKCTCNVDAYVKLDTGYSYPTPHTFTGLVQGSYHTLLFDKQNYISQTKNVIANIGTTVHVNLVPASVMGFDINVNISGLTSTQNKKLWVEPVVKIPLTDTWIPSGVHGGIQWERAYNRRYLARDSQSACDPQPNKYFTGSTNKLEANKNYAVFVGDTVLSTYPGKIVYKTGSSSPVTVNVTSDYYDWLSRRVCGFLGVSESQCSNWFGALFVDIISPVADLYTIFYHKSLYTDEPEEPTALTYFCAALGCIPLGGVVKQAGKLKYTDELADLAKISSENSNIFNALKNGDFISKIDNLSKNDIDQILSAAKRNDFNFISNMLKFIDTKISYNSLNKISSNVKSVTSDPLAMKTMAEALDFASTNGYKLLELLKGVSTNQVTLSATQAGDLIKVGKDNPSDLVKIVETLTPDEVANTVPKLKASSYTPVKVAGSLVDDANLVIRDFKQAPYETVESCMNRLSRAAESAKNHPNGEILYADIIDGSMHYVKKVKYVTDDVLNSGPTEEASKIVRKAAENPISTWPTKVSNEQASLLRRIIDRIKIDPGVMITLASGVSILALWFIHENAEEMLGIEATSRGKDSPSDITWTLRDKMGVIDADYWNVHNAEQAQNWTTFCIALIAYEKSIEEYKTYGESHKSFLQSEGTYETFKSFSDAFDIALNLKREVHPCGLPSEFTATIVSCTDADTVDIKYDNVTITCRLLGINSPETKGYIYSCTQNQEDFLVRRLTAYDKECLEETTWHVDQAMYDSTVDMIRSLLPTNTSITVKIDKDNEKDKYGRLLAVFYRGNTCINTTLLRSGLATVFFYSHNSRVNTTTFLQEEKVASDAKYGIWQFAEGTGSIKCISENETACKIWLDGRDTDEQTVNNQFILTNVLIGNHNVSFTKEKSGVTYSCNVDVTVIKDQTVEARCTLTSSGPTPTPSCPNPTASFDMAPSTPKDADNVSLDGTDSSAGTDHWITKFEWILNQVTIGTGIFHSFIATIGDHILTLKTTNDCGNVDSATKSFSVSAASCPNPTASFVNTPASPEINEYMYANASDSSGDPGAEIQRYEWYVDDILVSTGVTASFVFGTVGTRSLKLKVINTCGSSDTKTKYINVTEPAACPTPTASFINTPASPEINEYMHVDASGSSGDATAQINQYEWYIDDVLIKTGMTTNIVFSTTGVKLLKLKVINTCGGSDVKTKYITVNEPTIPTCPNPSASYVMAPSSPDIDESVMIDASDSKGGTGHSISSYEWILDGYCIGYGITTTFNATQGDHILTLVIKNDCGNTDSATKAFDVGPSGCPNPTASFIMAPTSPKIDDNVILDASASKPGTGSKLDEYKWYINNIFIGMGVLQSFTARPGIFILKLEVINACYNSDFISKSFTVADPTPAPGPVGTIYCRSQNETACEIWLDNVYTGKKTVSNVYLLDDIPVGPHTVTFKKMKSGIQYMCSVSLTVLENQQAQADCTLTTEITFPIDFKSNPLNAIITKQ